MNQYIPTNLTGSVIIFAHLAQAQKYLYSIRNIALDESGASTGPLDQEESSGTYCHVCLCRAIVFDSESLKLEWLC
jgi:hypothetical protein